MAFTAFETAIKTYLDDVAAKDELFAKSYNKPNKSIKECCAFIMGEAQKAANGKKEIACKDEEIYGLAMHYFDEDDIEVKGTPVNAKAVQVSDSSLIMKPKKGKPKVQRAEGTVLTDMNESFELEIPMF